LLDARLRQRLRHLRFTTPMVAGRIYCSGDIINPPELRPVQRVGYMGFDHENDFRTMLPELVAYLRRNGGIVFELFGSIPKPAELDEFGDRIVVVDPVRDYGEFLTAFAARQWDIALCPLAHTPFNAVKANTKWVEYTCVGAAVVATSGHVYDECCSGGCGELVADGEWLPALERLTREPSERFAMVAKAQDKVRSQYGVETLRRQVLSVFGEARRLLEQRDEAPWPHAPAGAFALRARRDGDGERDAG
jgi:hypothetical protein